MTQAVALAQYGSTGISQGFKNRIINGAMVIDQRNAGASVSTSSTPNVYTLDRWMAYYSTTNKFTIQQDSSVYPTGFSYSLKITSSAATTPGSGDEYSINQNIEGYNIVDLDFGLSTAKTITLSFWVRSSLTGTFGGAIRNGNGTRSYPFSYTISAANTWEQKSITIAGDTTGTWQKTNLAGFLVGWSLGNGSTNQGTAGAWVGSNKMTCTGETQIVGTNGATFYLAGVQLEAGSTATSFEYRSIGTEMLLCQRYYAKSFTYSTVPANGVYSHYSGTFWEGSDNGKNEYVYLPVSMRTSPTFTLYGNGGKWQVYNGGSWVTSTDSIAGAITDRGFTVFIVGNISNSSLHPWYCKGDWVASAEL